MQDTFEIERRPLQSPSLRDVAAVFFRHLRLIKFSFLTIAAAGILYSALFPSYKSEMKILVRRGRIDPAVTPTPSPSPAFEHDEITEEQLNSEAELLRDRDVLRQVVLQSGLARPTWTSKVVGENQDELADKAVLRLATKLEVQPVRKSRLITVSYASGSPELSAAVLQSLSQAYLSKQAELHRPAGEQSFFEAQVDDARRRLNEAQGSLIDFTRREHVVSAGVQRDFALQRLSEAQASELSLESAIAEAQRRSQTLQTKLRKIPERRVAQVRNSDNPDLQSKLKSKLLELELERTQLLTKFQPSYRLVQELDEQIAVAKKAIADEDEKPLRDETTETDPEFEWAHSEQLKNDVELAALREKERVARSQVEAYQSEALRLEQSAVIQQDLEQKLKSAEDKWLLYSNKREEARIGDALDRDGLLNVTIAEAPHAPLERAWPLWAASCLWVIGAGGISAGLAFAADYIDPSFRTPEEVMAVLGTPVLACLPAKTGSVGLAEAS